MSTPTPATLRESVMLATCDAIDLYLAKMDALVATFGGDHDRQVEWWNYCAAVAGEAAALSAMTRRLIETGYPF